MIKRSVPLRRSTKPIKRSAKPLKRVTVRKRRPGPPRRGPKDIPVEEWRCPAYLQFLREEGICVACKASHLIYQDRQCASGYTIDPMHGPPNGRSQKGPDAGAIPGCRAHHEEQTAIGWPAFCQKYGFDREREARVWYAAYLLMKEAI